MIYGEDIECKVVLFENKPSQLNLINIFNCGNKDINNYLKMANEVFSNGMGVTKLITNENETEMIGFYTLCSSAMLQTVDNHNRALPAIELKMFAIDLKYQDVLFYKDMENEKYTFSSAMFSNIIEEIINLSNESMGIKFIILQSVTNAILFYRRNFFVPINEINEFLELPYDNFSTGCKEMCYII